MPQGKKSSIKNIVAKAAKKAQTKTGGISKAPAVKTPFVNKTSSTSVKPGRKMGSKGY